MIAVRILISLGLGWLLWALWRRLRQPASSERASEAFEPMVACAICDTHIPRRRAQQRDGQYVCERHAEIDD